MREDVSMDSFRVAPDAMIRDENMLLMSRASAVVAYRIGGLLSEQEPEL
jgi:hypothetical protein